MQTWTIRPMEEKDVTQAAAMEREIFSEPWSAEGFLSSLRQPDTCYLVAEETGANGKEIIGYCGYLRSFEEADITNVAVSAARRRRGVARDLLSRLMQDGKEQGIERFTLEVRAGNTAAVQLYETLGFQTEGRRKNFYRKPTEDALIMWTSRQNRNENL